MTDAEWLAVGTQVLYREARLLDARAWDEWLALYAEDCVYWVPAWDSEHELTTDPERELSLIYYASRAGLEDRVWRIRSGKSVASMPLPRTTHMIGNIELLRASTAQMELHSAWTTHVYLTKRKEHRMFFGTAEHTLRRVGDAWLIARKKITLVNDTVPTMVDVYCL
jgi:3-phenylpropionate/cinnamic acid dioxygenase small subunit